jgi:hypothetical protein
LPSANRIGENLPKYPTATRDPIGIAKRTAFCYGGQLRIWLLEAGDEKAKERRIARIGGLFLAFLRLL